MIWILSEDISPVALSKPVRAFKIDKLYNGMLHEVTPSGLESVEFPGFGAFAQLECLAMGYSRKGSVTEDLPWIDLNSMVVLDGGKISVPVRVGTKIGDSQGTPMWDGEHTLVYHYDGTTGHVIVDELPGLPDGVTLDWLPGAGPWDVGSLAAFMDLLSHDQKFEPTAYNAFVFSSVSIDTTRDDGLVGITVILSGGPSTYTVYMDEASHYSKPTPHSTSLFWNLIDAITFGR